MMENRKHKMDFLILLITIILMIVGVIIIYAIGPMRANFLNVVYGATAYSENSFFLRQLFSVVVALVVLVVTYKLPFRFLKKYSKYVILVGLVLCVGLWLLQSVGSSLAKCELGACRWYNLGFISFQPAEVLKLGAVLYFAEFLARKREGVLGKGWEFWLPFGLVAAVSLFFVVVVQKDLGSAVPIVAIIMMSLWMSGISKMKFFIVVGVLLVAAMLAIFSSPHRRERLMTFKGDDGKNSYHIDNALIAIGTGGLAGVGVGNSVQATGYLPESINDSVFAVMGETFGLIGLFLVMICFFVLLNRLLTVSEFLADKEQSLIVAGVFAWILTHVVVNIASMTGLIPLTGITLPLLSYGGTSMMFISMAIGLALQLSCYTSREKVVENSRKMM